MIRVAICSSDDETTAKLEEVIREYFVKENLIYDMISYSDVEDFDEFVHLHNIIVMDVDTVNSLKELHRIRDKNGRAELFILTSLRCAGDVINHRISCYIEKPLDVESLIKGLNSAKARLRAFGLVECCQGCKRELNPKAYDLNRCNGCEKINS